MERLAVDLRPPPPTVSEYRARNAATDGNVAGRPDFEFRLALVELRVFALKGGERLVVPATLARTTEVERAIVRVTYAVDQPRPLVEVQTPAAPDIDDSRPDDTGGRGLEIARAVSLDVGCYASGNTKNIWASFPRS